MKWTNDEVQILKEKYPKHGKKIQPLLKNHTEQALMRKASNLNIKCDYAINRVDWFDAELFHLKHQYPTKGANIEIFCLKDILKKQSIVWHINSI